MTQSATVEVAETGEPVAAVSARGLHKRFPTGPWRPFGRVSFVQALRGLDVDVPTGTLHGVVGRNGSGKSTLLRILATLVIADEGTATVAGHDVRRAESAVRRAIGFSAGDERAMYWRLSARQNLEFAAALHAVRDERQAIDDALQRVNLAAHADRPVSGLSQGMARRLGLARATLHRPRLLLLDEPTRSLDPVSREEFRTVLDGMRADGISIVMTTHDLDDAARCDAVTVIREGRTVDVVTSVTRRALTKAMGAP